jgi:hypothetical protein
MSQPLNLGRSTGQLERLAAHLADYQLPGRCDLVDGVGGRCRGARVAVQWEHGFADFVCEEHAASAIERGALVVRGQRHDGTETAASGQQHPSHNATEESR